MMQKKSQKHEIRALKSSNNKMHNKIRELTKKLDSMNKKLNAERTKKNKFESEYIKERNFNEKILNSMPGIFLMIDQKGKLISWNKNAAKTLGYTDDEISKNKYVRKFIANEYKKIIDSKIEEAFEKGSANVEASIVNKKGRIIPFLHTGTKIDINGKPQLVIVSLNITERKNIEDELRKSEEKYRELAENIPLALFRTTPDGKIISFNSAAVKMGQYESWDELHKETILNFYPDPEKRKIMIDIIQKHGSIKNYEFKAKRKDRKSIWVSLNVNGKFDEKRKLIYLDGVIEDISQRKEAENALKESEEKYRNLVNNLTVGVFRLSPNGKIISVNPAIVKYWDTIRKTMYIELTLTLFSKTQTTEPT